MTTPRIGERAQRTRGERGRSTSLLDTIGGTERLGPDADVVTLIAGLEYLGTDVYRSAPRSS